MARERKAWGDLLRRALTLVQRLPDDFRARQLLSEASELALGDDQAPASLAVPLEISSGAQQADLVMAFESLGGGRSAGPPKGEDGGCEFGFFQRGFGAEPLSLLRWATIQPADLLRGLQNQFAGVGEDGALQLRTQGHYDWQACEHRYNIQIDHTHLDRSKVSLEAAHRMVLTRFRFLRRKLIDDLTLGEKIFVYRLADQSITPDEIDTLAQAINQYGPNTLLFVMRADGQEEDFLVRSQRRGLIVATLPSLVSRFHGAWLGLCQHVVSAFPTDRVSG